ncbi:MAG: hypothetical protein FWD78_03505 [Treponema sp.]|nr:hypothetical protein [Treponema sp.]
MKRLFFAIFGFIFINTFIFSQQILFKINDNILDYIDKNPPAYLTQGTAVLDSPDGRIDFYKYKAETADTDTKFLVQGSTVFGVMQSENGTTNILYDITGDGILDIGFNLLFMPFWVLSGSDYTKISSANNLLPYLDNGLEMFNSDDNPYQNGIIQNYVMNYSNNTGLAVENRDLFYGMLEYYSLSKYPNLALMLITELGIRYNSRFGSVHPLFLLHTAESMINLGYGDYARPVIESILSANPDFVPALVYSWQLETDPAVKKIKYDDLKKNHPNHWIVRQI